MKTEGEQEEMDGGDGETDRGEHCGVPGVPGLPRNSRCSRHINVIAFVTADTS